MSGMDSDRDKIIGGIWVKTPQIAAIYEGIEDCLEDSRTSVEPSCKLVRGDSGTGKSLVSVSFSKLHLPYQEGEKLRVPVIWFEAPTTARPGAFVEVLLNALGVPTNASAVKIEKGVGKIIERIRLLGVRLVVIDEAQQMIEGKENEVSLIQTANIIKRIINTTRTPFILFGMPHAKRLFDEDAQLRARFRSPLFLSNYDFKVEPSRAEFLWFLQEVAAQMPFNVIPQFGEQDVALAIYQSGSGNPRLTMNLLRKAGKNAVKDGSDTVEVRHLTQAFETEMRGVTGMVFPNPFRTPPAPQSIVASGSWVKLSAKWAN